MARIHKFGAASSGRTILIVDDSREYLDATRMVLEREGHTVQAVDNGAAALAQLQERPADLLLLDFHMPGMNGEEVVSALRRFNPHIQVILQTGYANETPPREMLKRLDIQGYYDKSEGPEKLLLWVDVGLKAAFTVRLLEKSRRGLRHILDAAPEMQRLQPLDELLREILLQLVGLTGAVDSFLAVSRQTATVAPDGFLALLDEDSQLVLRAGTGRFEHPHVAPLDDDFARDLRTAIGERGIAPVANGVSLALRMGEETLGVLYLDRPPLEDEDRELLGLFANQAASSIMNSQLYEMAAYDKLTGAHVRRFFDQWLVRELRQAHRACVPLTLMMVDLDGLKAVNDTGGHLAGDRMLARTGKVLRRSTRDHDFVARYGGDEFALLLPGTPAAGAAVVASRILKAFAQEQLAPDRVLRGSIGYATLLARERLPDERPGQPLESRLLEQLATDLVRHADVALYTIKRAGGAAALAGEALLWP